MKNEYIDIAKNLFGNNFDKYIEAVNSPSVRGFIVNTSRVSLKEFDKISALNATKLAFDDSCYMLDNNVALIGNPVYDMGLIYPKEPSSMIAPLCMDLKPTDVVLDVCASPGGKTCQIANAVVDGIVYANEYVTSRLGAIYDNVSRMAYDNVVISSNESKDFSAIGEVFDKILIDAPCSGEGMFRKDKSAQNEWTLKGVRFNHKRSVDILNNVSPALKKGGLLVYSTCTFNTIENEEVVVEFLENHKDFELVMPSVEIYKYGIPGITVQGFDMSKCLRFYPHTFMGEGQFVAVMKKCTSTKGCDFRENDYNLSYTKKDRELCAVVKKTLNKILNIDINIFVKSDKVYAVNANYLSLPLRIVNMGVYLGTLNKDVFKPDHNLFVVFGKYCVDKYIIDDKKYDEFVHGYEIDIDNSLSGFVALQYFGVFVGGGKVVNGKLKNCYPKSRRKK